MKVILLTIAATSAVFGAVFYVFYNDSQKTYNGYRNEISVLNRSLEENKKALDAFKSIDQKVFKQSCEAIALENYSKYIKDNSVKSETEDTISYYPRSPEVIKDADKMRMSDLKKCDEAFL